MTDLEIAIERPADAWRLHVSERMPTARMIGDAQTGDADAMAGFRDARAARKQAIATEELRRNEILLRMASRGSVWLYTGRGPTRVVFLMLNPSTADAFVLDPTVKRCISFATSCGADVLEVVNIFALRSTDPFELRKRAFTFRGDDQAATDEVMLACRGAHRVVAGWGKHGALGNRGDVVRSLLAEQGIGLHHLGLNKDGSPKHPLYLKGGTEPQVWLP